MTKRRMIILTGIQHLIDSGANAIALPKGSLYWEIDSVDQEGAWTNNGLGHRYITKFFPAEKIAGMRAIVYIEETAE